MHLARLSLAAGATVLVMAVVRLATRRAEAEEQADAELEYELLAGEEAAEFAGPGEGRTLTEDIFYSISNSAAYFIPVLGGLGFAGDVAEAGNARMRESTVRMAEESLGEVKTEQYVRRQAELNGASDTVDEWLDTSTAGIAPNAETQAVVDGLADFAGAAATAPIEVAAILDTAATRQAARIAGADTPGEAAAQAALSGLSMAGDVIIEGGVGWLADQIAQTPEQKAEADRVLHAMNQANLIEHAKLVPPPPPLPVGKAPVKLGARKAVSAPPPKPAPKPKPSKRTSTSSKSQSSSSKKKACNLTPRQRAQGKKC